MIASVPVGIETPLSSGNGIVAAPCISTRIPARLSSALNPCAQHMLTTLLGDTIDMLVGLRIQHHH